MKVRERGERERGRPESEGRAGGGRRGKASAPSSCPSGGPGVCSCTLSRTTEPGTALLKQVLLTVPLSPRMAAINTHTHTQSAQCRENMLKMTTPRATAHGKERREKEGGRKTEMRETKTERGSQRGTPESLFYKGAGAGFE